MPGHKIMKRLWRLPKSLAPLALMAMTVHAEVKPMFDFRENKGADPAIWQIVNDGVMGGISESRFVITNGMAEFSGKVSLENNGGFASVRSLPSDQHSSSCEAFVIRVRGDGRTYKFTARTSRSFDSAIYQVNFKTRKGEWEEHRLPISSFVPTFRGRTLSDAPPLDSSKVTSVGFLISDKQDGPFRLDIAWIRTASGSGNPSDR